MDEEQVYARHPRRRGKVLIVGVGAVGSSLAKELARLGFSPLHVVDHDELRTENIVRHELGASFIGRPKASALAEHVQVDFPLCEVIPVDEDFLRFPHAAQAAMVQDVDVVVAATDTAECQQRVNEICLETGATAVFPSFWVDEAIGVRDAEVGEIFWYRCGRGMPCYLCLTGWRPAETGGAARGGARADIQVLVLATAWVVAALLNPNDERSLILDPQRSYILVHGFMPHQSESVRVMFRDASDSGFLSLRVPAPSRPCPACGRGGTAPAPRPVAHRLASLQTASINAGKREHDAAIENARREQLRRLEEEDVQLEVQRREDLSRVSSEQFREISDGLREALLGAGEAVRCIYGPTYTERFAWEIAVGDASLGLMNPKRVRDQTVLFEHISFPHEDWGIPPKAPFDAIAFASLGVSGPRTTEGYRGRWHSLWFCDAQAQRDYRWYETAFILADIRGVEDITYDIFRANEGDDRRGGVYAPMSQTPEFFEKYMRPGMYKAVWPFTPVAPSELDEFVERWAGWLADAADGRMTMPHGLSKYE